MRAGPAAELIDRVDAVQARLALDAGAPPPPGLTTPDPPSGEQWDWGQVWAHLGEFVPFWAEQVRRILSQGSDRDPVPFGRTKGDHERVAAIERDRGVPPPQLYARLVKQLDDLRALLDGLSEEDWSRRGLHSTLGPMEMPRIVQEFLVGHLESHADQLDGLMAAP
jgi:hypothetical protein